MFRLAININLIQSKYYFFISQLEMDLSELDPDATILDPRFDDDFKVTLHFEDFCPCTS